MKDERVGFGSYRLGVAADLRTPTPIGLEQAISWGAPVVELQGEMGRVGKTGVEAIKHLAKANKVELTWHVPPIEDYELAYPSDRLNRRALRGIEVGLKHAKETGIKLITIHPTQILPRLDGMLYVYDRSTDSITQVPVPEEWKPDDYLKILNEERANQIREQIVWARHYAEGFKRDAEALSTLASALKERNKVLLERVVKNPLLLKRAAVILGFEPAVLLEKLEKEPDKLKDTVIKVYENKKEHYEVQKERERILRQKYEEALKKGILEDGYKLIEENAAKNLAKVAKKAIEHGVKLAIENPDSRYIFSTPEEINELLDKVKENLKKMGVPEKKIEEYVGVAFDMGHANTLKDLEIELPDGRKVKVPPPEEFVRKLKHKVIHVHAHENFGDVDAHLPLGEAFTEEQRKKIEEFLKEKGFKGEVISEAAVAGTTGLGYTVGMRNITDLYMAYGIPTEQIWGPSYLAATPMEGLILPGEKRESYFYGTFVGGLF